MKRATAVGGLLLAMPAIAWTAELLAGTPLLILGAAAGPALLLAAVIVFAQRGGGRSVGTLAFSLAWGAVGAAWLSTVGNESARRWVDALTDGDDRMLTALLVAPLLEEGAKALGLLLLLRAGRLRSTRDGIVCGALVGVGFVFAENLLYLGLSMLQGGEAGLWRALHLRGLVGAAPHIVFTACAGAGLGWAVGRTPSGGRWVASSLGVMSAIVQHIAWNALAAPAIAHVLCDAPDRDGACLEAPTYASMFWESGVVALVFLAPGLLALGAVWRTSARRPTQDSLPSLRSRSPAPGGRRSPRNTLQVLLVARRPLCLALDFAARSGVLGRPPGDAAPARLHRVWPKWFREGRSMFRRTFLLLAVAFSFLAAVRIVQPLAKQVPLSESCWFDLECARDSCCHARACVHRLAAPGCRGAYCSMDCKGGTLDCGGKCTCRDGRCSADLTSSARFYILPPEMTVPGPEVPRHGPGGGRHLPPPASPAGQFPSARPSG